MEKFIPHKISVWGSYSSHISLAELHQYLTFHINKPFSSRILYPHSMTALTFERTFKQARTTTSAVTMLVSASLPHRTRILSSPSSLRIFPSRFRVQSEGPTPSHHGFILRRIHRQDRFQERKLHWRPSGLQYKLIHKWSTLLLQSVLLPGHHTGRSSNSSIVEVEVVSSHSQK